MENGVNISKPMQLAFAASQRLSGSRYDPMPNLQYSENADGAVSYYISADDKALMFYDYCVSNNIVGRIINDEITMHPMGEYVLVEAKAYVYQGEILKGTGVAGQTFRVGEVADMDRVIQFASGLAKSRALTNAGYGIISRTDVATPSLNPAQPSGSPPQENRQPAPPAPAGQAATNDPNDPVAWAKSVPWKAKKATMGELLATSPKDILWAAKNMRESDVAKAATILVPMAQRAMGM